MLLKTRAILVVVVGTVMGLSLSLSGGLLANRPLPEDGELAPERARLMAEVMQSHLRETFGAGADRAVGGAGGDHDDGVEGVMKILRTYLK